MARRKRENIIIMHCHIFPDKIEEKAVSAIGAFYDIPMQNKGTSEFLLADGRPVGVNKYLVCSTATTAHQVESINNFVAREAGLHPEFIGFGSLHPDYEDVAAEIDRMLSLGLRGIKLHPDFQKFNIDDERAFPIYKAAEGRLPILFHTGDDRYDFLEPQAPGACAGAVSEAGGNCRPPRRVPGLGGCRGQLRQPPGVH